MIVQLAVDLGEIEEEVWLRAELVRPLPSLNRLGMTAELERSHPVQPELLADLGVALFLCMGARGEEKHRDQENCCCLHEGAHLGALISRSSSLGRRVSVGTRSVGFATVGEG